MLLGEYLKRKMKIDWFYFITGIFGILFGVGIIILKRSLIGAIILIFFGILNLLKSYFQDKISIWRLFKK